MKIYETFPVTFKKFKITIDKSSKKYFKSIWHTKNNIKNNLDDTVTSSANIIYHQFYINQKINSEILLQNKNFTHTYDKEFSNLIKQIINHINITNDYNSTKLLINKGLFKGINIDVKLYNSDVSLNVRNMSYNMKNIILSNYNTLKKQLLDHEIKLKNIRFIGKEALSDNEHNSL